MPSSPPRAPTGSRGAMPAGPARRSPPSTPPATSTSTAPSPSNALSRTSSPSWRGTSPSAPHQPPGKAPVRRPSEERYCMPTYTIAGKTVLITAPPEASVRPPPASCRHAEPTWCSPTWASTPHRPAPARPRRRPGTGPDGGCHRHRRTGRRGGSYRRPVRQPRCRLRQREHRSRSARDDGHHRPARVQRSARHSALCRQVSGGSTGWGAGRGYRDVTYSSRRKKLSGLERGPVRGPARQIIPAR